MEKFKAAMAMLENYVLIVMALVDQPLTESYKTAKWVFRIENYGYSLRGRITNGEMIVDLFDEFDNLLLSVSRTHIGDKRVMEVLVDAVDNSD